MTRRFTVLFLIGLGLRLLLAWLPIEVLITRTLPDDAFIYFVISRNLAAGLGATFDGLHPTNGFHPLWPLLTAPLFWLSKDAELPLHLALSLEAVCDALAGGLTAWLVTRVTKNQLAGDRTLVLYLFNPRLIQESVNGLETGLGMLALAVCLAAWFWAQAAPTSKGRAALFGLSLGFTFLARSDLVVISGLFGLAYFIQNRRQPIAPLLAALVAGVTVAPWLIWSQLRVGTIIQSSGVAIPSLVAARIQSTTDTTALWNGLLFPIINFSLRDAFIYPGVALLAVVLGILLVRWPNRVLASSPRPSLQLPTRFWLPLVGALVIVLIHTVIRWYPRGWYFAPLAWAWTVLGGPVFAAGLAAPLGRRYGWLLGGLLGLTVIAQSFKMLAEPEYRWQGDMRAGASWLAANTASTDTIGAFNAGLYAYYSGRRVLSLDGLVDWGAIEARQQKRLLDYFVEQGGQLVIDHQAYVASFGGYFGPRRLEPTTTLPVLDPSYGPIQVYRVTAP